MDIALSARSAFDGDALVFFLFEKEPELPSAFQSWLEEDGGWLAGNPGVAKFSGRKKSVRYFFPPAGTLGPAVILAGLGMKGACGLIEARLAVAAAMGCAMELELAVVGLDGPGLTVAGLEPGQAVEETVYAAMTAAYRFDQLKTEPDSPEKTPPALRLLLQEAPDPDLVARLDKALAVGHGLRLARDLVNLPSNLATPEYLAATARNLAREHGYGVEILDAEGIQALGMGAFAAVFQARPEQARLIVLDSHPPLIPSESASDSPPDPSFGTTAGTSSGTSGAKPAVKPLVLIGKGITFDTGGISLKPSSGMEEMKGDMGGAAAVLGFFEAHGRMADPRRVVGIIPCTENVPGSRAVKPGEVVTTYSGKSVEIVNTDAEGRLLLCDALAYSARYAPAGVIDLATLTGAMVVALGPQIAGAFASQDKLADLAQEIGAQVGEPVWPMPLWEPYLEELKSEVADLKNVGARAGGAIHAALFLHKFVPEKTPWVHLDIAGPAFSNKKPDLGSAGGTGFGVRTLVELVQKWPEQD